MAEPSNIITCEELTDSRSYTEGESATLKFVIRGTAEHDIAMKALKGEELPEGFTAHENNVTAPSTFSGLIRQAPQVDPVYVDLANPGRGIWSGTVSYRQSSYTDLRRQPLAIGSKRIEIDTTGGMMHLTQSLSTVQKYPSVSTTPDFKGAIGCDGQSVQGVDVPCSEFRFRVSKAYTSVTQSFLTSLYSLRDHVNADTFSVTDGKISLSFAAGEVLYGNYTATNRNDGIEMVHHFTARPNETGKAVGDITGISKNGHEYLWVYYDQVKDTDSKKIIMRPAFAYVEQLFKTGDFSAIGL